ncbi:hypothetical protein Bhyg_12050 [Pseudolycoriella hygida]|uniref:Uncharacterized protein n=1 Tax=Pseudolycoriella hygida TaxID=35572 RepID=A0A9Q0MWJ6_9DIPT|nr:hypothetical protein Bhyg_12050 [Pseudolycoriella hygida]
MRYKNRKVKTFNCSIDIVNEAEQGGSLDVRESQPKFPNEEHDNIISYSDDTTDSFDNDIDNIEGTTEQADISHDLRTNDSFEILRSGEVENLNKFTRTQRESEIKLTPLGK